MTRYAVGLGSNVGDRLGHLINACRAIGVSADWVSPLYETDPIGGPDQGAFLNAVALVESPLAPHAMLDRLQEIESAEGRVREVRWGPRTLDLDLITSDGPPCADERLTLPHPRVREREFVLRPLADVWPEAPLGDDLTAARALEGLEPQGVNLVARDWFS